MKPQTDLTLFDCQLEFEAGVAKPRSKEFDNAWLDEIKRVRIIRANILVDGFELERALTQTLDVLYKHSRSLGGRDFNTKIQILAKLINTSSAHCSNRLIGNLNKVREGRNRSAHWPMILHVSSAEIPFRFQPALVRENERITLTSEYVFGLFTACAEAREELGNLRRKGPDLSVRSQSDTNTPSKT